MSAAKESSQSSCIRLSKALKQVEFACNALCYLQCHVVPVGPAVCFYRFVWMQQLVGDQSLCSLQIGHPSKIFCQVIPRSWLCWSFKHRLCMHTLQFRTQLSLMTLVQFLSLLNMSSGAPISGDCIASSCDASQQYRAVRGDGGAGAVSIASQVLHSFQRSAMPCCRRGM